MRARIAVLITVVQSILLLAHWFLYHTWAVFQHRMNAVEAWGLRIALGVLSVSFITATILAIRYSNFPVRLFYRLAAVWLGFSNFFFLAACGCWIIAGAGDLFGRQVSQPATAETLFGLATLSGLYGLINAAWIRTRRITVDLPGLPPAWQDRTAMLVSDTHLGAVHGEGFMRHIVDMVQRRNPDIVFIAGDLFDGTKTNYDAMVAPWKEIHAPFGVYFVTGNHEEFSDPRKYVDAAERAGVRVLQNELTSADGLQIVGVSYGGSTTPEKFRAILGRIGLDSSRASILLSHMPRHLAIAEQAGISLQLSGHTHGGQLVPYTWIARSIFRRYTYGLHPFGRMLVYTSYGAGTWGPPLRFCTSPEIVLMRFRSRPGS